MSLASLNTRHTNYMVPHRINLTQPMYPNQALLQTPLQVQATLKPQDWGR